MARPLKPIDAEQVYKIARLGCTQEEIADVLGCARSVITTRFATEYTRARAELKMSLRRAQVYRAVKDRSDTMLVHLGKVYLGQGDVIGGDAIHDALDDIIAHGGEDPDDPAEVSG